MALHNTLGQEAENLAAAWLEERGYELLHRNWRHSHYEIDIIAVKNNTLCFIEVKARKYSPYGHPEDNVTKKKIRYLQRAADEFLFQNPGHEWVQYHILAITLYKNREPEFFLLEDVYFS